MIKKLLLILTSSIFVVYTLVLVIENAYSESLQSITSSSSLMVTDQCASIKDYIIRGKDNDTKLRLIDELQNIPACCSFECLRDILVATNSFMVQQKIIHMLSKVKDKRVLPLIVEYLTSPFFTVRESVIMALKSCGDDRMYPYILKLAKSKDVIYRVYALEALYHLYDNRFYEVIALLLKDENKSVRYYALECVVHNSIIQSLPIVRIMAAEDENNEVRIKAMQVLSDLGDKASYSIFIRALLDSVPEVREAAVEALSKFPSRDTAVYLSRHLIREGEVHIKKKTLRALLKIRDIGDIRGIQTVLYNQEEPNIQIFALYVLGILKDNRTLPYILSTVNSIDYRVRAEAANTLGQFKGKVVVITLLDMYEKESEAYVKSAILYSLKKICDPASLSRLFTLYLKENDMVMKMMCAHVLHHIMKHALHQY